jgi:hydrogenase-4 component B
MSALWSALLLATPGLPLLLAVLVPHRGGRRLAARALPYAPWPGLLLALTAPDLTLELPTLALGVVLGLEDVGRVFLVFTAIIWSLVGLHLRATGPLAASGGGRFLLCYLLALTGNLGLILALEPTAYYAFFSMLTFAAYGLIVTRDAPENRSAGRLYLVLAIVGEMTMLAGFMLLAAGRSGVLLALLFYFGMGVKHAVLPLHVWLPRAHGIAPAPASALLSGAMLKAGVIGWLRALPSAGTALSELAVPMLLLGLTAAFYAAFCGVLQAKPKMLLGYSSVSQMGILTAGFALAAAVPAAWPTVVPALLLFALHHALVKAALFLGVGVRRDGSAGRLVLPALVLLSLALAGLPLTGGYLAKHALEAHLAQLMPPWQGLAHVLLPLTGTATTVLMGRFLWLSWQEPAAKTGLGERHVAPTAFLLLGLLALTGPWLLVWLTGHVPAITDALKWKALWPLLLGGAIVLTAVVLGRRGRRLRLHVPPGDVAVPLERGLSRLRLPQLRLPSIRRWPRLPRPDRLESTLLRFGVTGVGYLLLVLLFAVLAGFPFTDR